MNEVQVLGSSGECRADDEEEEWEQVCGWAGQSGGKEVRTSGGQLEDYGVLIFGITARQG